MSISSLPDVSEAGPYAETSFALMRGGFAVWPYDIVSSIATREEIRAECDRLCENVGALFQPSDFQFFWPCLYKLANVFPVSEMLKRAAFCEELRALMLGLWPSCQTVDVYKEALYVKGPFWSEAGVIGWHRDVQYWPDMAYEKMLTVILPFDDMGAGNGGVRVIPGSHILGVTHDDNYSAILPGAFVGERNLGDHRFLELPQDRGWEVAIPTVPFGCPLILDPRVIHGSWRNAGGEARRSLTLHMVFDRGRG